MAVKYFGARAVWLRLTVLWHNVLTALKRLAFPAVRCRPLYRRMTGTWKTSDSLYHDNMNYMFARGL